MTILLVAVIISLSTALTVHAQHWQEAEILALTENLSGLSEDECVEYIIENDIEIPLEYLDSPELGAFVKWVIEKVETNSNYDFMYNYEVLHNFVVSIRDLFINKRVSQLTTPGQSNTKNAAYTLQDNTQYGGWDNNFFKYNCYIYSIGRTDVFKDPGYFSNRSFSINMSIYEMANLVKNDLEALGMGGVYISNIRPNIISPNETLIAIRKTSNTGLFALNDYHFMKYHPDGGFWTHKPGGSAILKYNYQPADKVWIQEGIIDSSGTSQKGNLIYDSEIYYIVYNWKGLRIQGNNLIGFTPQAGFNGTVNIPNGVMTIGYSAFSNQIQLSQILIPSSVTSIGAYAFDGCINLNEIHIPSSVTTIGNDAFKNTNNASIYLDGKTTVPSTFSYYWNPSGNPVYLNGNLCTHTFKTTIELNETQHGDYCFDCRTLTNKTDHSKYLSGEWQKCHYCPYSKFLGHTHSYTYTWLNLQEHKRSCSCGDSRTTPHIISGSWNGQGYTTCLACGGPADSGIMLQGIDPTSNTEDVNVHISQYFGNESFILNNGIIVLSELDLIKYYDGTLILPYECDGLHCCSDDIDLNVCCDCSNNYINESSSIDSNSNKDLYLPSRREYYISISQ